MTVTVDEVVGRYIQLRQEKELVSARHEAELAPLAEKMSKIEAWLMAKMQADGVDSYKTAHGTPYRSMRTSVSLADRMVFMDYVMEPAAEQVCRYLEAAGYPAATKDLAAFKQILSLFANWDMVDFRAGKKGIEEQLEATGQLPPGINRTQVATVNVRKA